MVQVFLSYARADGMAAATQLRGELNALGMAVWRDLEEMEGGLAWKKQLLGALGAVDAVLVLLTPGAVASPTVGWEWETALLQEKRVIPLLIAPCDVPAELRPLHYHRLDDPATYALGLAHLARDLVKLAIAKTPPPSAAPSGAKYNVGAAINSAIGDNPLVINQGSQMPIDAAAVARLVAALRAQQGTLAPEPAAELAKVLDEITTVMK